MNESLRYLDDAEKRQRLLYGRNYGNLKIITFTMQDELNDDTLEDSYYVISSFSGKELKEKVEDVIDEMHDAYQDNGFNTACYRIYTELKKQGIVEKAVLTDMGIEQIFLEVF